MIGIELKNKLTTKGLRQSEVEYYLWADVSYFPFIQIITDMESGGFAYYALPDNTEDGEKLLTLSCYLIAGVLFMTSALVLWQLKDCWLSSKNLRNMCS